MGLGGSGDCVEEPHFSVTALKSACQLAHQHGALGNPEKFSSRTGHSGGQSKPGKGKRVQRHILEVEAGGPLSPGAQASLGNTGRPCLKTNYQTQRNGDFTEGQPIVIEHLFSQTTGDIKMSKTQPGCPEPPRLLGKIITGTDNYKMWEIVNETPWKQDTASSSQGHRVKAGRSGPHWSSWRREGAHEAEESEGHRVRGT